MDRISDEVLEKAIQTQEEFICRYRNRYKEEAEFDIVILAIMKELQEVRKNSGESGKIEGVGKVMERLTYRNSW